MVVVNVLRVFNFLVLGLYIYFLTARGIRFNLLTIIPVMSTLACEIAARYCIYKLNQDDEG